MDSPLKGPVMRKMLPCHDITYPQRAQENIVVFFNKPRIVMIPTFRHVAAAVVVMTSSGAASDDTVGTMIVQGFQ